MNNLRANTIDWNILEKKWSDKWNIEKIFQANIDPTRKKYFVTVAYPYPNSPQHIGHGRTYIYYYGLINISTILVRDRSSPNLTWL